MRPIAQSAPDWTTVAAFGPESPSRRCFSGGTALPPRCSLPARSSPSHPRRASTCNCARWACRSPSCHAFPTTRRATDVVAAGLPAIVDDADGNLVGVFGLDELKIAARRDPVLAAINPLAVTPAARSSPARRSARRPGARRLS